MGQARIHNAIVLTSVALKVLIAAGIAYWLLFPDLPQFENKSMTLRALLFPTFALTLPAAHWYSTTHRYRHRDNTSTAATSATADEPPGKTTRTGSAVHRYPHALDALWTFTFTFDLWGNNFNFYNDYYVFQHIVHFVNSIPYTIVIFTILVAFERIGVIRLGFWATTLYAVAILTSLHMLWETWEFLMDELAGTDLQPGGMREATEDNLYSLAGSMAAAALLFVTRGSTILDRSLFQPLQHLVEAVGVRRAATGDR